MGMRPPGYSPWMVTSQPPTPTGGRSSGRRRGIAVGGKIRTVRVPDELWDEAQEIAAERGESLSEVIRAALERYVKRHSSS